MKTFAKTKTFHASFRKKENFRETKFRENLLIFPFAKMKKPFSFQPYAPTP
jgi:hypothetical protein